MTSLGLRDLLAHNLRKLCAQEPSISSVCRTLDINRQQFNNYLSGRNLPNEVVVRQLCNFFEISPYQLFLPPAYQTRDSFVVEKLSEKIHNIKREKVINNLPEGSYYVYFEAALNPEVLVRSYMNVAELNGFSTFSRITRVPINMNGAERRKFARHDGFIQAGVDDIYLSGYNVRHLGRPSLLVGRRLSTPPVLCAGVGLLDTGNGTETVGFAITRAPAFSIAVMRSLGLVTAAETPATRVVIRAIDGYRRSFSLSYSSLG